MKTLVCVLFSLFSSSIYSETTTLGDSLNALEQINQDEREADCDVISGNALAQESGETQSSFLEHLKSIRSNEKKFNCKMKVVNGCNYHQCTAPERMFYRYPKPMAILVPANMTKPSSFRMHIHGFSYFNKKYDKSLDSMVDSFKYGRSTCKDSGELIMIPYSANNKNTYHHDYLGSTKKFDEFMEEFQRAIKTEERLPVTLSGHSGGGRVISQIVSYITHEPDSKSATRRVKRVEIHDGLYASDRVSNFASWFERSKGVEMNIYSIQGTTTSGYSNSLFNKFGNNAQRSKKENPSTGRDYIYRKNIWGSNTVSHIEEKKRNGEHHWELSRDYWNFEVE